MFSLMYIIMALNVIMFSLVPNYTMFGNQVHSFILSSFYLFIIFHLYTSDLYLFIHQSIYICILQHYSICLFFNLSIYLFVFLPSIYLYICMSIYLSVFLYIHLSIYNWLNNYIFQHYRHNTTDNTTVVERCGATSFPEKKVKNIFSCSLPGAYSGICP